MESQSFPAGAAKRSDIKGSFTSDATTAQVMVTDAYYASSSDSAYRALQLMVERATSGLPVLDDSGTVVGYITDGAILRALSPESHDTVNMSYVLALWAGQEDLAERVAQLHEINVMELAFHPPRTVEVDDNLESVCDVLSDRLIKKVAVTRGGKFAGVISRTALMRSMLKAQVDPQLRAS